MLGFCSIREGKLNEEINIKIIYKDNNKDQDKTKAAGEAWEFGP